MMSALLIALAAACAWLLTPGAALQRLDVGPPRRADEHRRAEQYPTSWRAAAAVGVVGICLVGVPDVPALALALGGGTFLATGLLRKRVSHRHEREEMPDTLEYLAVCLESGAPISGALDTVADVSPVRTQALLRRVLAHLNVGRSVEEAWEELGQHPVWGTVAKDMVRASRSGTSLSGSLRIHADDVRMQVRDAAMKRARKVGVKSVIPLMACFLPAFVLIGVVPIIASLLKNFISGG
ncbi:type II secretion system F family protein [uncultured Tessaracoccus sp.]|uniref:type II secretion system F family protein n=1 Tax=uncultured Tessaracoccus sp. TaxID=905023 RepID=UPI002607D3A7|nr:type II secretion system F family protein [uncultured Tessaracoccus sp.]